jgi:two-component system heavy metal sensor histidine kinase CusS
VNLSVQNSGATIDPEHINKIFDRFYRAIQPGGKEAQATQAWVWP